MPTRKKIGDRLATKMNLSQVKAQEILQQVFAELMETLVREKRLELRNFGIFELRMRASRMARNPKTNECMKLPPRLIVAFKPGKELAAKMALLSPPQLAEEPQPPPRPRPETDTRTYNTPPTQS